MAHTAESNYAGRKLTIETGKLAEQASGSVTVRYGDTIVLAAVVGAPEAREDQDFFPLTVDYEEKMYAAGKIPGGFIKREGRPTENAILTARLTDRPLRPLFPKGYRNEVQLVVTVLSVDQENDPDILSIIGASAALSLSEIPFNGPVGAARVGYINGELVLNPLGSQMAESDLDLILAGTMDAVVMAEGGAREVSEDIMLEAVKFGHEGLKETIRMQQQLVEVAGKPKLLFQPPATNEELLQSIRQYAGPRLAEAVYNADKTERQNATAALKDDVMAHFTENLQGDELAARQKEVSKLFDDMLKDAVRRRILDEGIRPDGRDTKTIRPIWCEVGVLPRAHGTGLFTRGQTQVLTVATLGATSEDQKLDGLGLEESKRYMHHYNFPPFSTGEVKRMRGPSRRDIGHGALAERALVPVLPATEEFPYVLRLVSEVLSSNGSSSMASVCGSTLALMDAGVPIKSPVAGIAMGLITGDDGKHAILTDIQGLEDALGDMDFKVAGTASGVTAVQMDIKTLGITYDIMHQGFAQARAGRMHILQKMLDTIAEARPELSPFAPRILRIKINPEKIGAVIGPGGKMIRSITESTGTKIDLEDDGSVFVYSTDGESADKAIKMIEDLTREAEVGAIYLGKVVRIMPYGAFVQILPGKDGLVHISELAETQVQNVEDVVQLGDEINVMVTEIDRQGKISLSRRAVLTGQMPKPKAPRDDRPPFRGGPPRGPHPGGGRPR